MSNTPQEPEETNDDAVPSDNTPSKTLESGKRKGFFQRFLDFIAWAGNKLPHPVSLFGLLAILVIFLSWAWC